MALPSGDLKSSKSFFGFEDRDRQVAIVIAALPPDAYAELDRSTTAELLEKQGVTFETREDFPHPLGKAFLVIGRQQAEKSEPAQMDLGVGGARAHSAGHGPAARWRAPSLSATTRCAPHWRASRSVATIPVEEQLSLLPFGVRELAGFRIGGVLPGRAIMLTDGKPDDDQAGVDTHIVAALAPGRPAKPSERDNFARDVFATIPNLKDVRITSAEPLRLGGYQAHQIMALGKDTRAAPRSRSCSGCCSAAAPICT